jgi:phosphoribosylglycinamide formyltransferase-1
MKKIAIFASGAGTNAEKIIQHPGANYIVALIGCNKPGAGIVTIAENYRIPVLLIEKKKFIEGNGYVDELKQKKIDLIVLAGFLWKIPDSLIEAFPRRIINIHPALLPKYGGKGMYGHYVHEAVIRHKEKESGITIHYVDGHYDNGDTIYQASCPVLENDSPDSLAQRVRLLEHEHYPRVVMEVVRNLNNG